MIALIDRSAIVEITHVKHLFLGDSEDAKAVGLNYNTHTHTQTRTNTQTTTPHSLAVVADRPLRLGKPIVPPVSAEVSRQLYKSAHQAIKACAITPANKDEPVEKREKKNKKRKEREESVLTGHGVPIHVIEDVPKAEDPGGGGR